MFEHRRVMASLRDASHAPSIHNSQPWRFRVVSDSIEVMLDASDTPRIVDPSGRWALASIGAVLATLEVAMVAHTGRGVRIAVFPTGAEPLPGPTAGGQGFDGRTIAIVHAAGTSETADAERAVRLAPVIRTRRTTRSPLRGGPPTADEWASVVAAAGHRPPAAGARCEDGLTATLLELTARAEAERAADPAFLGELQRWIDHEGDTGIPHEAAGAPDPEGRFPGRDFTVNLSGRIGYGTAEVFEDPPALLVVHTPHDTPHDQVLGGYATQNAMLEATALGLGVGVLGQALEEPGSRCRVDAVASGALTAPVVVQQLLRLGHVAEGPEHPAGPVAARRPVSELIVD